MTLLEKALNKRKHVGRGYVASKEEVELICAALEGRVSFHDAAFAAGKNPAGSEPYNYALKIIRSAVSQGLLEFKIVKKP